MVTPSKKAQQVAETLVEADDIQKEVLMESAETGTESGRSVCGGVGQEPLDRGFEHVSFPSCSGEDYGLIHGGGGHDFRSPKHSLIDMGLVLFDGVQASLVVGMEKSDLFLSPTDESRERAISAFQDALGHPVRTVADLSNLIENEQIDPAVARMLVRDQLDDLFYEVETNHTVPEEEPVEAAGVMDDFEEEVIEEETGSPEHVGTLDRVVTMSHNAIMGLIEMAKDVFSFDMDKVEVNLAQLMVSQVASALVLVFFLYAFGGTPKQMVRG